MEIRIRESGAVVFENEFRAMFPNTGFPVQLTPEIVNDFGGDVVLEGPQAQPTRYQVAYRDGVQQIDGQWFTKYSVSEMDDEAKAALTESQANSQRAYRNTLLSECDWTQLPDSKVNQQAWANYRQALRDVTAQAGFPWEIEWPTKP